MIFAATALVETDALLDKDDGASLKAGSLTALRAAAAAGAAETAMREAAAPAVTGRTVAEERTEEEARAMVSVF